MSESSAAPLSARSSGQPLVICHDAIWGFYANVTSEQLSKISRYFLADDDELFLNEKTATRLHAPDLNFVVFPEKYRAALLKEFTLSHCPLTAERGIVETPPPYQPPVLAFLSIGEPEHGALETSPNYYQDKFGLTPSDIPELIRLYQDPEIICSECSETSPVRWSRIQAQRAFVELRAPAAARLMLEEIRSAGEDADMHVITSEAMQLIPLLGNDAYTTILALLDEHRDNATFCWDILPLLADIAHEFAPERREHCIDILTRLLENHPVNERLHNAVLVASLCELKAVEVAPLIEQAYSAGHIDDNYYGDWEDVQISLGLKTERDTSEFVGSDTIRSEQAQPPLLGQTPYRNPASKVGRNDPCPCGSGKKYKKCCMQ